MLCIYREENEKKFRGRRIKALLLGIERICFFLMIIGRIIRYAIEIKRDMDAIDADADADAAKVNQLKVFIEELKANPSILSDPSYSFFTHYLHSLGAKLPESARPAHAAPLGEVIAESSDKINHPSEFVEQDNSDGEDEEEEEDESLLTVKEKLSRIFITSFDQEI